MARYTFPRDTSQASQISGPAGTQILITTDTAGKSPADIQTTGGATITNSIVQLDANGNIPSFLGPDTVTTLHARLNGSTQSYNSVRLTPAYAAPTFATGGGTGSGVPNGGAAGNVLVKNSAANGDAGWVSAASPSNANPQPTGTVAAPGVGSNFSREDHVHVGGGTGTGIADSWPVVVSTPAVTNDVFFLGGGSNGSGTGLFSNGRGNGSPFRLTNSLTCYVGCRVTAAGSAGSLVRIGIFNDDGTGKKPGTVFADLGTVDTSTTGIKYSATSVALSGSTRYWVIMVAQGGATTAPTINATVAPTWTLPGQLDGSGSTGAVSIRYSITGAFANNPTPQAYDTVSAYAVYFKAA